MEGGEERRGGEKKGEEEIDSGSREDGQQQVEGGLRQLIAIVWRQCEGSPWNVCVAHEVNVVAGNRAVPRVRRGKQG